MSKKQLPALPEATTAEDNDLLLKRDDSSGSDQKLSIQTLRAEAFGDAAVEDASVTPTPDTLAKRDGIGRIQAASGGSGNETVVHDDTSTAANANTIAKRDGSGRLVSAAGGSGTAVVVHDDLSGAIPIGSYVTVQTDLTGAEEPDPNTHIKLEAGLTGVDEYNEGKLNNESVTGSAPLVVATAEIVDAESPLFGQTVHLLETEERFLRAGQAGRVQDDQMQRITGEISSIDNNATNVGLADARGLIGAFSGETPAARAFTSQIGGVERSTQGKTLFNSASSPDARASSTADGETRAKNIGVSVYMRIK